MTSVASGRVRVSEEAGFLVGEESLHSHARVYLPDPVIIPSGGKYIYLWVSNESPETKVWFDDFRVAHTTTFVSESTDYGVWGDVLRTSSTEPPARQSIRKGLKGQYAFAGDAQNQTGSMNGTVVGQHLRQTELVVQIRLITLMGRMIILRSPPRRIAWPLFRIQVFLRFQRLSS